MAAAAAASDLRLRGIFGTGFITFKWQNDDTEDEILDTMRMAVIDLDEIKHILETKIREYKAETKSYGNLKTLCSNFNKITDTLITLWRGTHKLQELQTFPTLSFLEHVMRRCYKNSFANSSSLEEFDKNLFDTTDAIFKHLKMNEDDVFIDINCGVGSVVLQMAASGSFKYCYGVSSPNEAEANYQTMVVEFTKWMGFYGKDYTDFQIFREELTSSEMLNLLSESTVVFLKDTDVEPKITVQISQLFSQLKEGIRVVSLKNCEQFFGSDEKTVQVEEFEGKHSGSRYFVHIVKLKERSNEPIDALPSVPPRTAAVPKRRNSTGLSSQKKNNLQVKHSAKSEIPGEVRETTSVDSLHASLDKILNCYRMQFIKFVEFMQSPEYRQQLEGAVKRELLRKTELEEKLQSLMHQISELNGSSMAHAKKAKNEISDEVNYHSDLLVEVQSLLNQNKELRHQELKLNDEIGQLERVEIVKQCQDQLSHLRTKEGDLSTMNRQYLVNKASEWYQNYIYLSARVKSLEAEVAVLEGRKENVLTDRHKPIEQFMKSFCKKSSEISIEEENQHNTASLLNQDLLLSNSLESNRNIKSLQKKISDGNEFERTLVDKHLLGKFCGPAFAPPCTSSVSNRLIGQCTSGDPTRCFSPVVVDDAGHLSGLSLSTTPGSSSAHAQKRRHRSSSSTDTADSLQDVKLNSDGDLHMNIKAVSGLPVSLQNDVLRLTTKLSKPENLFQSVSSLKQHMHMSEALKVLTSYATYTSQANSNAEWKFPAKTPELISSAGKGKPAAGKRGRRKRTAGSALPSDSSVSDKSVDAGNLDALFLAVSLHHLSPRHRDLSHDSSTETRKSKISESCKISSVSSLPQQTNNLTVAMATGQSSFTVPSWSLLQGAEFRTPMTSSLMSNMSRQEHKLSPELGIDDSHGKHFKKRLHSSNFKLDQDQKSSSKVLCNVSSTETTTPILKYLFTKQEASLPSLATPKGSSEFYADSSTARQLIESYMTTSCNSSALQALAKSQTGQITVSGKSLKDCNLPPQSFTDLSQYLNAQQSDVLKLSGTSRHSLPMSSLLKSTVPWPSSHSDVFATAHTLVPGTVLNQSANISTKAQINSLSMSQASSSKE